MIPMIHTHACIARCFAFSVLSIAYERPGDEAVSKLDYSNTRHVTAITSPMSLIDLDVSMYGSPKHLYQRIVTGWTDACIGSWHFPPLHLHLQSIGDPKAPPHHHHNLTPDSHTTQNAATEAFYSIQTHSFFYSRNGYLGLASEPQESPRAESQS